jgi:hypothetical protein
MKISFSELYRMPVRDRRYYIRKYNNLMEKQKEDSDNSSKK